MLRRASRIALAFALAASGCRRSAPSRGAPAPATSASAPRFDLELSRASFIAYGASTPLPLTGDLQAPVPELAAPMQKVARNLAGARARMRVARDVPYAQVWRVISAGAKAGVGAWSLTTPLEGGPDASVEVTVGLGLGPVSCFASAWVGPDGSVTLGLEAKGILVKSRDRRAPIDRAIATVHRLDDHCADGELRLNTQPSAAWGPVFDLAHGLGVAADPPKVRTLRLGVGNVAPVDMVTEVVAP